MKSMCSMLAVFSMICLPAPAFASEPGFKDGNQLAEWCSTSERDLDEFAIKRSLCLGYINGVYEMLWANSYIKGTDPEKCLPKDITTTQISDIVESYMKNRPDKLNTLATIVIFNALNDYFPGCLNL